MKRIFPLLIFFFAFSCSLKADELLKEPLRFIHSDSVIVWGEDRSDFRTTALSVAPELKARQIVINEIDEKQSKKELKEWHKDILPSLNICGGLGNENDLSQVIPVSDMLKKAGTLFLKTADASFLDVVERTALNSFMSVLTPGDLSFEKHIVAQALMNVSGMIYATDDVGIFVNFYINSSTHVKTERLDFVIDQLTAMPHSNRVKLRISGMKKGQQPITLRLRMPSWVSGEMPKVSTFGIKGVFGKLPTVYVNGREEFYKMENGFLVINRNWNSGDEVFFDFPFEIKYLCVAKKGKLSDGKYALQRGPLVYAFTKPTDGLTLSADTQFRETQDANAYGHSVVEAKLQGLDGKELLYQAEPLMDGAKHLWINVSK